jgi:hypothetical protein
MKAAANKAKDCDARELANKSWIKKNAQTQEGQGDERCEAAERAHGTTANGQGFFRAHGVTHAGREAAHGLLLVRSVGPVHRLVDAKEIEIGKDGRGVFLFHNAAAGAARIVALNFATDLHDDLASAGEIRFRL